MLHVCVRKEKEFGLVPKSEAAAWSAGMALRLDALCRHCSQAMCKNRRWLPQDIKNLKLQEEFEREVED